MEQLNSASLVTEEEINKDNINQPSEAVSNEEIINEPPEAVSNERNANQNIPKRRNLWYEECLGFIPNSMKGRQDPRYVYAKFMKQYKDFDYTNEDFLTIIEELGILQQLKVLQISKPNKSIDVFFRTEDAADIFVKQIYPYTVSQYLLLGRPRESCGWQPKGFTRKWVTICSYMSWSHLLNIALLSSTMRCIITGWPSGMVQGRSLWHIWQGTYLGPLKLDIGGALCFTGASLNFPGGRPNNLQLHKQELQYKYPLTQWM